MELAAAAPPLVHRLLDNSERPADPGPGHTAAMQEAEAGRVAEALRGYGLIAHVARPSAYRFGIRLPLGDGREALWDVDGAAGLEAQIMRDGVLVGLRAEHRGLGALRRGDDRAGHRHRRLRTWRP